MTSGDVMDRAAALLNDAAKSVFTYTVQLPYLNMAMDELQEYMELNNVSATNKVTVTISVVAGVVVIDGTNGLPTDLIEIQELNERPTGTLQVFVPMTRMEFLPQVQPLTTSLMYWSYQEQVIKLVGATANVDVRIDYIKSLFTNLTDVTGTTSISLINAKSFLAYRTAGLIAEFVGENQTRAEALNGVAVLALDRQLGINVKGGQAITTKRRPFMASSKIRGY